MKLLLYILGFLCVVELSLWAGESKKNVLYCLKVRHNLLQNSEELEAGNILSSIRGSTACDILAIRSRGGPSVRTRSPIRRTSPVDSKYFLLFGKHGSETSLFSSRASRAKQAASPVMDPLSRSQGS